VTFQDIRLIQMPFALKEFALCGGPCLLREVRLDELIESGTVLDHCGAKLFSDLFGSVGQHRDGVRRAVVLHHARVRDRDIRGALFEVAFGIAAGLEERSDQVVGFSDRGLGVIEEAGLHGLPLCDESRQLAGAKFASR
jgi:hypothetical protein